MTRILNYLEVLEQIKVYTHKVLLLGNGFSMAYDSKRFSYTSLLNSALDKGIIKKGSALHKAFQIFSTSDFEMVIKSLENTNNVLSAYNYKEIEEIREDSKNLKKYLVDVVTNNHPNLPTDITEHKYRSAINFIKNYTKIYTLNYDLLLYWVTMKYLELVEKGIIKKSIDVTDGFANGNKEDEYVEFLGEPNILYLHGGLHIFDKGSLIIKNTFSRTDIPLKEQTLENLKNNIYPVFISEGTSEQKLSKIMHNSYLNVCFRRFRKMSGKTGLVIFGTKFSNNDDHIVDAIMESKCNEIFFPVSSEEQLEKKEVKKFISKNEALKNKKKISFYNYKTVNVWDNCNETKK